MHYNICNNALQSSNTKSIEFRSKLGFNQYDIIQTKEQSVLKSVMDAFEG